MGFATSSFQQASSLFSHWPTDWIILGAVATLLTLDALRSGAGREIAIAFAAPLAMLLLGFLPKAALLGAFRSSLSNGITQASVFFTLFSLIVFFVNRIVFFFTGSGGVVSGLIAGIAATAVLTTVWLQIPALQGLYHFGPQVQAIFGEAYRFWWLLVAYAGLAFVRS